MAKYCYVCNRKLNAFSDYKNLKVDGVKKEICMRCFHDKEKKEVAELLHTSDGKTQINIRGTKLILIGFFEIPLSILLMLIFKGLLWFLALVLFIIGCISIYKGISYRYKVRKF